MKNRTVISVIVVVIILFLARIMLPSEDFDCVLISIGRSPLTDNIGLDEIGVNRNKGFIEVDISTFQTSVENIYAVGDIVLGTPQLAHVGFAEGIAAIKHISTGEKSNINYRWVNNRSTICF